MFTFGTVQALQSSASSSSSISDERGADDNTTHLDGHCKITATFKSLVNQAYNFIFGSRARAAEAEAQLAHLRGTVRVLQVETAHYKQLADLQNKRVVELQDTEEDILSLRRILAIIQEQANTNENLIKETIRQLRELREEQANQFHSTGRRITKAHNTVLEETKRRLILLEEEINIVTRPEYNQGTIAKRKKQATNRKSNKRPKLKQERKDLAVNSDSDTSSDEEDKKPRAKPTTRELFGSSDSSDSEQEYTPVKGLFDGSDTDDEYDPRFTNYPGPYVTPPPKLCKSQFEESWCSGTEPDDSSDPDFEPGN